MRLRSLVLPALAFLALAGSPAMAETPAAAPNPAPAAQAEAAPAEAAPAQAPAAQAAPAPNPAGLPQDAANLATATRALALQARPAGATLTWGQNLAAEDLERLAKAADAFDGAVNSKKEVSFADAQAMVTEMQTAATRVQNTVSISALDAPSQGQALALVAQVKGIAEGFSMARKAAEQQVAAARNRSYYRPRFGFGVGYGSYWGRPYWGYPGYGWGRPYGWGWGRPGVVWGAGWSTGGWAPWRY